MRQRGLRVCGAGKLESAECARIAWVPTSESQAGVASESDEWLGCQVSMWPKVWARYWRDQRSHKSAVVVAMRSRWMCECVQD